MSESRKPDDETQEVHDDAWRIKRLLKLSRRTTLPIFSYEEMEARIPKDWKPEEDDVDEFLNSIRGRGGSL